MGQLVILGLLVALAVTCGVVRFLHPVATRPGWLDFAFLGSSAASVMLGLRWLVSRLRRSAQADLDDTAGPFDPP